MRPSTKLPFFSLIVAVIGSTIETEEQRLLNSIFGTYNKHLRPILNATDVINVTLDPNLFSIVEADEASESLTIVLWLYMEWQDAFIHWNMSEFSEMNILLVPNDDIWKSIENLISDTKNYALIYPDGKATLTFAQILTTRCEYDISMFPFDVQTCTLNVGSWMYTKDQLDISYETPTDISAYNENPEWDLISIPARKYTVFNRGALRLMVDYDIIIQRKPTYYLITFLLPCFIITAINIIGIFTPFNDVGDREEKVSMGLTTLLTMTVVLTLIADMVPKSSEGLPLLGSYIVLQIGIAAVTSLFSVIILHQNRHWASGKPVPAWLSAFVLLRHKNRVDRSIKKDITKSAIDDTYANALNEQNTILKTIDSAFHEVIDHLYEKSAAEELRYDWLIVCNRLDNILLFVFLFLHVLQTAIVLIIGYSNLKV